MKASSKGAKEACCAVRRAPSASPTHAVLVAAVPAVVVAVCAVRSSAYRVIGEMLSTALNALRGSVPCKLRVAGSASHAARLAGKQLRRLGAARARGSERPRSAASGSSSTEVRLLALRLSAHPDAGLVQAWEAVIGLETHVQLNTATKAFCGCRNAYGGEPNSNVCPVCLGLPVR